MLKSTYDPGRQYQVVAYLRVSTDQQNVRSTEQQLITIQETMQRLRCPWKVVRSYRDEGISGRYTRRRPQLQKMLHDLRSRIVVADLVVVDTFERLTRAEDGAELRNSLRKLGVLVVTADSNFSDPESTSGRALAVLEGFRSGEEGRIKAHNVLRGKKDSIRRGRWPGGVAPLGYRLVNVMEQVRGVEQIAYRQLEPDPATRPVIDEIFRLADELGWGTTRIARALNVGLSIPADLKPFNPSTIGRILDNPIYVGTLIWGRNATGIVDDVRVMQSLPSHEWLRLEDFCTPLVARDRWEQVQKIREARRRVIRDRQSGRTKDRHASVVPNVRGIALKYPLSGLVRCVHCRRAMTITPTGPYTTVSGEVRRYVTYSCTGYLAGACVNDQRIPEEWLRNAVFSLIQSRLFQPFAAADALGNCGPFVPPNAQSQLNLEFPEGPQSIQRRVRG